MTAGASRSCWQNCGGTDDDEVRLIDAMEDAISPLDEQAIQIRRLITLFEACYHEADKEAEFIAGAIGAGHCPERSNERPPQRQRELENARRVLSAWCKNPALRGMAQDVGGIRAEELLSSVGEPNPLKRWQVARIRDKIGCALDASHPYRNMALPGENGGAPGAGDRAEPYGRDSTFLQQTKDVLIHDTVDGRESKVSLAFAIDLLMPCGWDFVGSLVTILKAVGEDLHPQRPLACCARNVRLSPLCGRLRTISDTLHIFWANQARAGIVDSRLLASLGAPTPVKQWLAASLDKTIRLHLDQPFDMDLF